MSTKRPPSTNPVPVPVPAPPPVQRVPKPKYDETFRQDAVRCGLVSGNPFPCRPLLPARRRHRRAA